MEREKYLEAVNYENIKELIYGICYKHNNKTAFIIKHKDKEKTTYEDISFTKLLEDINNLGTKYYDLGLKDKRIAIVRKKLL